MALLASELEGPPPPVAGRLRTRRPWWAALLNFLIPGLGYLYAGLVPRAVVWLLLFPAANLGVLLLAVLIPVQFINIVLPAALILGLRTVLAWDAGKAARQRGGHEAGLFSRWYSSLAALAISVAVVYPLWNHVGRTTLVEKYILQAGSMESTMLRGEHVLAVKWAYGWHEPVLGRVFGARQPARGELVVFRFPEDRSRPFIKRVIGLPGETVAIRQKVVLVNSTPLEEPYAVFMEPPVKHAEAPVRSDSIGDDWGPQLVPADSYFVLGDFRDNSRDSRFWGFVPRVDLLGRATVVYWSWNAQDGGVRWRRIGRRLE